MFDYILYYLSKTINIAVYDVEKILLASKVASKKRDMNDDKENSRNRKRIEMAPDNTTR